MRLFVALPLPDAIRTHVHMLCGGLPRVKWVPPENFHISLRFIGEVDGGVFDDVDASLTGVHAPRFSVTLSGVGHFGNSGNGRVRVLWAGVAKEPALQHLHDKIESAVVRAGLPPDGQKYTPHVTLARPKAPPPIGKLQTFLAHNNLFKAEPFEVTSFTLYSSLLGGSASVYRPERDYELGYA